MNQDEVDRVLEKFRTVEGQVSDAVEQLDSVLSHNREHLTNQQFFGLVKAQGICKRFSTMVDTLEHVMRKITRRTH